ncbi:MAG TPA: VWA domain-containing protein [Bryobacteraceae bacterium]|nr:VWA domain-containing protein [Bryobacteraceae bacterium]
MKNLAPAVRVKPGSMAGFGNRLVRAAVWGAVAACGAAFAQPAPLLTPAGDAGAVFRADTRLVVCHTTVTDRSGHLVTDLPPEAFSLRENGLPQRIKTVKREDVPVALGLVIDNSGSMTPKRAQVEAASLALVQASNPDDEVFVVNFNDEVFLDMPPGMPFTHDLNVLQQALKRIDSRGGTAMRDAIQMSVEHLKEAHRDKKVIVVVTDGDDNYSGVTLEELVKSSQQAGVLIYSIGLLGEEEPRAARQAKRALETLAEATGAWAFFASDCTEVDRLAHQVAQDIRNQYIVQYSPANQTMDGKFRAIKIGVKGPGGLTVRTRPGYWATQETARP